MLRLGRWNQDHDYRPSSVVLALKDCKWKRRYGTPVRTSAEVLKNDFGCYVLLGAVREPTRRKPVNVFPASMAETAAQISLYVAVRAACHLNQKQSLIAFLQAYRFVFHVPNVTPLLFRRGYSNESLLGVC